MNDTVLLVDAKEKEYPSHNHLFLLDETNLKSMAIRQKGKGELQ